MNTLVTIIIPTRDRRDDLSRCLKSIEAQSLEKIQVIVVDDGSSDGTKEMVVAEFPNVEFIESNVTQCPAHSRNLGISRARGNYLHFLDSDSELPNPDTVATLVEAMRTNPDAGCIGGEIPCYLGVYKHALGRRVQIHGKTIPVSTGGANAGEGMVTCDYLATLNCFVRRDIAEMLGGFDEVYGFGAEDVDFGLRVQRRGFVNYVLYRGAVYHHKSSRGRFPGETYLFQRGRVRLLWKLGSPTQIFSAIAIDLLDVVTFYPLLPAKIVAKVCLHLPIGRESYTGALILVRAYWWNLVRCRKIYQLRQLQPRHAVIAAPIGAHLGLGSSE